MIRSYCKSKMQGMKAKNLELYVKLKDVYQDLEGYQRPVVRPPGPGDARISAPCSGKCATERRRVNQKKMQAPRMLGGDRNRMV